MTFMLLPLAVLTLVIGLSLQHLFRRSQREASNSTEEVQTLLTTSRRMKPLANNMAVSQLQG
jgi:hypothetical protein